MLKLIIAVLLLLPPLAQAQKLEQIVAEAKKEGEVTLVASTSTFGGKKGFAELEALFAKRYGFKAKLNLSGGPSFPQMAARIITEQKAGSKSSTDMYLGSDGTFATMQEEKALEKVNWAGTFPWVTKEMEITPQESLLVYASFHGIIYNSNVIPKAKAPKSYEDLIDPALSPAWAGKMAIPAYIHWLIRLTPIWGKEKVLNFARKLAPLVGGRLRQGEEERIVSGEFPIMASTGGPLEAMWKWQTKNAPLVGLPGSSPATFVVLSTRSAEKFGAPEHGQIVYRLHDHPRGAERAGKAGSSQFPFGRGNDDWRTTSKRTRSSCRTPSN